MGRAVRLARRGVGWTRPNPPVGAVVVRRGVLVGWGFHARAGEAHAEVVALRRAGPRARGATLYVTLEPCHHVGRTPPCTGAIVAAGIVRVVAGVRDPNPHVHGGGVEALRRAGVRVDLGVGTAACHDLIAPFARRVGAGRPFVTLKLAASLDGKIATARGHSQWLSGEEARASTHRLRRQVDAILVGVGTVLADDPLLTYRGPGRRNDVPLWRVVLDTQARTPSTARLLKPVEGSRTLVVVGEWAPAERVGALVAQGVEVARVGERDGHVDLREALVALAHRDLMHVLIEGGSEVAASALAARVVDHVVLVYAPIFLGGARIPMVGGPGVTALTDGTRVEVRRVRRIGTDIVVDGIIPAAV